MSGSDADREGAGAGGRSALPERDAAGPSPDPAWTAEAWARLQRAPAFVRPGIVKLMARRARERGRTTIDSTFLTEIRNESMLLVARCLRGLGFRTLSMDAFDAARRRMRKLPRKVEVIGEIERFLARRTERNTMVLARFDGYLAQLAAGGLPWTEEARARLQRVPAAARAAARQAIEAAAREARARVVSGDIADRALAAPAGGEARGASGARSGEPVAGVTMPWTAEAEERLRRIPLRLVRELMVRRAEAWARARGLDVVDGEAYVAAQRDGGPDLPPPPAR